MCTYVSQTVSKFVLFGDCNFNRIYPPKRHDPGARRARIQERSTVVIPSYVHADPSRVVPFDAVNRIASRVKHNAAAFERGKGRRAPQAWAVSLFG